MSIGDNEQFSAGQACASRVVVRGRRLLSGGPEQWRDFVAGPADRREISPRIICSALLSRRGDSVGRPACSSYCLKSSLRM